MMHPSITMIISLALLDGSMYMIFIIMNSSEMKFTDGGNDIFTIAIRNMNNDKEENRGTPPLMRGILRVDKRS